MDRWWDRHTDETSRRHEVSMEKWREAIERTLTPEEVRTDLNLSGPGWREQSKPSRRSKPFVDIATIPASPLLDVADWTETEL